MKYEPSIHNQSLQAQEATNDSPSNQARYIVLLEPYHQGVSRGTSCQQ